MNTPSSEDLFKSSSSLKDYWDPNTSGSLPKEHQQHLFSPFESPPTSPRSYNGTLPHNPYFPRLPAVTEASLSRYNSDADSDDGCDNCTFLAPKDMIERLPDGAPGSPRQDGKGRHGSPILRSTQSVYVPGSPCSSECGEEDDRSSSASEREARSLDESYTTVKQAAFGPRLTASSPSDAGSAGSDRHHRHGVRTASSVHASESAVSSPLSDRPPSLSNVPPHMHTHSLTYVSTRLPSSPHAYSLLRRSCIRTLSSENLPRGSPSGPLLFGDRIAGYTIAYIFRLPDPRARGRRRTYALIALGGRDSWRVSKRYVAITREFESIASRIAELADAVLERESASSQGSTSRPGSSASAVPPTALSSSAPGTIPNPLTIATSVPPSLTMTSPQKDKSASVASSPVTRTITPVSSFLSAKKLDPDGYPRVSRDVMRAKGLAEIVGREDFFVELHARFCLILRTLV